MTTSPPSIRWNDARARWLIEQIADRLGLEAPTAPAEEFEWVTSVLTDSSAMTLYLAARRLADSDRIDDAVDVLGDACHAQRTARPTLRDMRVSGERPTARGVKDDALAALASRDAKSSNDDATKPIAKRTLSGVSLRASVPRPSPAGTPPLPMKRPAKG
jgi:hypothetical protein